MPMFNWEAESGSSMVSTRFWIYWAVAVPVTLAVLVGWLGWLKHHRRTEPALFNHTVGQLLPQLQIDSTFKGGLPAPLERAQLPQDNVDKPKSTLNWPFPSRLDKGKTKQEDEERNAPETKSVAVTSAVEAIAYAAGRGSKEVARRPTVAIQGPRR